MRGVHQTIHAAQRRILLARMIEHAGTGLAWGAAAGLAAVAADRLLGLGGVMGLSAGWWWLGAIPMAAGAGIGVARALLTRPSALMAAGAVDDALALRDRLTTGLTLSTGQDAAFTELALREADVAAASARPASAAEIRVSSAWYTWPSLAAVAACVGLFAPQLDLLGFDRTAKLSAIEQTRRDDVAASVAEAIEAVAPRVAEQALPDARASQLAELQKLREELEAGTLSADEATAKAVSELQSIAQESDRAAEQAAARSRAVSKSLSGLGRSASAGAAASEGAGASGADAGSGEGAAAGDAQGMDTAAATDAENGTPEGTAEESPLTRAVREGDLAAAREAARELMRRDRLSAQERQEFAEDLRKLAADIEQLEQQEAERSAQEAAERAAAGEEASGGQAAGSDSAKPEPEAREASDANAQPSGTPGEQPPGAKAEAPNAARGEAPAEQKPAPNAAEAKQDPKPTEPAGDAPQRQGEAQKQAREAPKEAGDAPKQPSEAPKQAGDPPRENQKTEAENANAKPRPGAEEAPKRGEQSAERTGQGEPGREASGRPGETGSPEQSGKTQEERTGSGTEQPSQGTTGEEREAQPQGDGKPQELREGTTPQQRDERSAAQERSSTGKMEGERPESGEAGEPRPGEKIGERREVSERELREQFERSGMTPQDAQRAAEKVGERIREEDAARQANEERRELAERLKEAAKSLSGERTAESPPRPEDTSQGAQPEQTGAEKGQPQSSERPEGAPDAKAGQTPDEKAKGEPVAKPEVAQPSAQERAAQPERSETGKPENASPEKAPEEESPGEQPQPDEEGGKPGMPDEIPAPTKQMLEQLAKHLDKMTSDRAQEKSDRAAGERAREQAQKLAESLSPQQQDRLRQWAEGLAKERPDLAERLGNQRGEEEGPSGDLTQGPSAGRPRGEDPPTGGGGDQDEQEAQGGGPEGGSASDDPAPSAGQGFGPTRTEIVDARGDGAKRPGMTGQRDQVVGEWLAPPTPGSARTAGPTAEARMRQAAKSAQQAVDDRAIPSRYDRLVQRYFRRLPEKVAERAAPTPPPVQSQDAP